MLNSQCNDHRYVLKVLFREDATPDQLIDVIVGNRKYMNCLYVYNKIDQGLADSVFRSLDMLTKRIGCSEPTWLSQV